MKAQSHAKFLAKSHLRNWLVWWSVACLLVQAVTAAVALLCTYISVRMMKRMLNPVPEGSKELKRKLCKHLGINEGKFKLDEYETNMLHKVMLPAQINCTLRDVAGADRILEKLKQDIQFSCAIQRVGSDSMLSGSKGLLLYGPPGTGKTMIASVWPSTLVPLNAVFNPIHRLLQT